MNRKGTILEQVPHCRALGIEIVEMAKGVATVRVAYAEHLVGNRATGVVHGGVITALLDNASGMAVHSSLDSPTMIATLDLRIDYMRPATVRKPIFGRAECVRRTRNVAFVRGVAFHETPDDPIATTTAAFMLASDESRRLATASADGRDADAPSPGPAATTHSPVAPADRLSGRSPSPSGPVAPQRVAQPSETSTDPPRGAATAGRPSAVTSPSDDSDRSRSQLNRLLRGTPYVRLLGLEGELSGGFRDGEVTLEMPFREELVGNVRLPALHGGAIGGLLEITAMTRLIWQSPLDALPKTIDFNIEYLRTGRPQRTFARGTVTKHGRRVANVRVEAWQEDSSRPIAAGHGHFLLR